MTPSEAADIESTILQLCRERGVERSICPSEAARCLDGDNWRMLMPQSARSQSGWLIPVESRFCSAVR